MDITKLSPKAGDILVISSDDINEEMLAKIRQSLSTITEGKVAVFGVGTDDSLTLFSPKPGDVLMLDASGVTEVVALRLEQRLAEHLGFKVPVIHVGEFSPGTNAAQLPLPLDQ